MTSSVVSVVVHLLKNLHCRLVFFAQHGEERQQSVSERKKESASIMEEYNILYFRMLQSVSHTSQLLIEDKDLVYQMIDREKSSSEGGDLLSLNVP